MIAVTGYSTTIIQALKTLVDVPVVRIEGDLGLPHAPIVLPAECDNFVLAAGVLHPKPLVEQTFQELTASMMVNFVSVVRICELALRNPNAHIAVVGSQSGSRGSYDEMYAGMKGALITYTRNRALMSTQRIVCLMPSIIADSGMTRRRHDYPAVLLTRTTCTAMDVARDAYDVLYHPFPSPVRLWPT